MLGALLCVFCIESVAYAEDPNRVQAQGLFDEGLKLMDAGRYAEACPKFADSNKLDPAGGTQMNLALCHEREGKTATAIVEYQTALAQAVQDKKKERESFAKGRIDALSLLVPKVVIRIPEREVSQAKVTIDGTAIPAETLGTPIPLDPGPHRVEVVFQPSGQKKSSAFSLRTGEARNVAFTEGDGSIMGGLGITPVEGKPTTPTPTVPASDPSVQPAPERSTREKVGPYLAWAASGALVASVVTGSFALGNYISYKNNCVDGRNFCKSQDGIDAASRTNTHAILSTVFLGVGAACLIAIPILPSTTGSKSSSGARLRLGVTPQGLDVAGVF